MFSTNEIDSFLTIKTTLSSFLKIKSDRGMITFLSLSIAPILISLGKFEWFPYNWGN